MESYNSLKDSIGMFTKIEWYNNGAIKYIEQPIKNKCLKIKSFYKNGRASLETTCLCGVKDYFEYDSLGNTLGKGKIKNAIGAEIGKWNAYYSSGKIKTEMTFSKMRPGRRIGKWIYYKESGEIEKIEDYDKIRKTKPIIDPNFDLEKTIKKE